MSTTGQRRCHDEPDITESMGASAGRAPITGLLLIIIGLFEGAPQAR